MLHCKSDYHLYIKGKNKIWIFTLNLINPYYRETDSSFLNNIIMADENQSNRESFKVSGDDILSKVKEIIKEGNARKILIKNDKDETIIEFPVTIGAIGAVLAPVFAAVGVIAALVTDCTIIVEKRETQK